MFALRLIEFAVLILIVYVAVSQIIIPAITGSRYFPLFNPAPYQSSLVRAQMDLSDAAVEKEALTTQQKADAMREVELNSNPFATTKRDEPLDTPQVSVPTQPTKE